MMSRVYIWDRAVRLSHWLLPILFATSWITAELAKDNFELVDWHYRSGYALIGVLVFRVGWGIWGSSYARFRSWSLNPKTAWEARSALRPQSSSHGFWGSYMSLALLSLLSFQVFSGLFSFDTALYVGGPWSDSISSDLVSTLTSLHLLNFTALQGLILVHVSTIIGYRLFMKKDYLSAMITGHKDESLCRDGKPTQGFSLFGLITALALAGLIVGVASGLVISP
ncbi:cytochrome b/b6 domain-containing protein [uncultured Umboniibacter sp.]|uniref:cytochrome b/b6 domain-containing protein n=1 Tax=uncultured Umboniibacter sp. TaxID=1798917 RepID=UPI00260D4C24|nr:cytochrome b/b6 domain-containing protein [uncultured Umboniibacter sp.]